MGSSCCGQWVLTTAAGPHVRGDVRIEPTRHRWMFIPRSPWPVGEPGCSTPTFLEDSPATGSGRRLQVDISLTVPTGNRNRRPLTCRSREGESHPIVKTVKPVCVSDERAGRKSGGRCRGTLVGVRRFVRVVRAANERAGLDVHEAEIERASSGRGIRRDDSSGPAARALSRPEVLTDRQNPAADCEDP